MEVYFWAAEFAAFEGASRLVADGGDGRDAALEDLAYVEENRAQDRVVRDLGCVSGEEKELHTQADDDEACELR